MNKLPLNDIHQNLLADIAVLAHDHLKSALTRLFDNTDDALFEYADKSASNHEQNKYFEAMREVRLKRKIIEKEFLQQVDGASKRTRKQGLQLSASDTSLENLDEDLSLSLVDHDELEETVAIETMASKLENQNRNVLTELTRRYAYMFGLENCASGDLDIGPRAICSHFSAAAAALELDIKTKLLVYKLFDKYVLSQGSDLFEAANKMLASGGVLPNLAHEVKRQRMAQRQQARAELAQQEQHEQSLAAALANNDAAPINSPQFDWPQSGAVVPTGGNSLTSQFIGTPSAGFSSEDYSLLTQLLGETRELRREEMPAGSFGTVMVSSQQIGTWLGEVQGRFIEGVAEKPQLNLYEAVNKAMARGAANGKQYSLGPRESDVVNVVAMLFEFILDDRNLAYAMQGLISRLQIPMLRVALLDSSFITDTNHAARRLLNELASAAVGWHDQANPQRDPLFKKMESIVNRVVHQQELDIHCFEVLLEELQTFTAHESQRIRLIEQRTRDMEEGKAKSQLAQREVNRLLKQKVGDSKLPKGVVSLLKDGWTKVLFLTYLKDGVDSQAWQDVSVVVDELLFSVRKRFSVSEYQQLSDIVHRLPQTIKQALDGAGFDPFASKEMLNQLALVHKHRMSLKPQADNDDSTVLSVDDAEVMQQIVATQSVEQAVSDVIENSHIALSGRPLSVLMKHNPRPPASQNTLGVAKPKPEPVADIVEAPHVTHSKQWVASLELDTWLEFDTEGGQPYRAKLAAIISSVNRYVFVNSRGVKVQEKSAAQLAGLFRNSKVRTIADSDLFDRAMHSVIANLRQMSTSA